ncbi:MAG: BNR-4 repeat-containing protein [Thermoguttaceae bacterium]|nr:BNR-4 repeat-containing protein [Thermoguttaceae bacterium]
MYRKCLFAALAAFCLMGATCSEGIEPTKGIPCDDLHVYSTTLSKDSFNPGAFSVAAWVKTDRPNEPQGVLDVGAPSKFFSFYLYTGGFRMLMAKDVQSGEYTQAVAPLPQRGVWTHYVGSYDGKTIRVYRNGKLVQEKQFVSELKSADFADLPLRIGGMDPGVQRPFFGEINDAALWNCVLSDEDVAQLYERGVKGVSEKPIALWNVKGLFEDGEELRSNGSDAFDATRVSFEPLLNQKDSGYRGVWYYNQKINNEYVYKYSGGMGTYPANHYPFSVYRPEVDKTFFCYGGFDPSETTLWHEVGVYDHKTKKVSRPTVLVDKMTEDAHDNPVMSMDDEGRIWVFSTSHGTGRPSYIHRSVRPYDVSEFELVEPTKTVGDEKVPMSNFSYFQVWNVPERGFISLFTTYDRSFVQKYDPDTKVQRILATTSSADGVDWSEWKALAAIEIGHYQNARVHYSLDKKDADGKPLVKIGTSFNYHPAVAKGNRGTGLNWRTNLYYMESNDLGKTWQTIDGKPLETPLLSSDSPALVRNYEDENLNVYVTDLEYDAQDRPIIGYVTSKGFESGPEMGPRYFCVAHWLGDKWEFSTVCEVDNNYELGMFYMEESDKGVIRLIGCLDDGPQAYNTGGEVSQWVSRDNGKTWEKEFQLTEKSAVNQCFPRRTIDASPDFYAFWATGNGREKSISTLRFSTKDGKVYELPRKMKDDWESPTLIRDAARP